MKKNLIFAAVAVLAFAFAASAQKSADFSGTWTLDVSRSKASMPLPPQTLTITQDAASITVVQTTKRPDVPPPTSPADSSAAGAPPAGGRMGGRGGMGFGDGTTTYTLDGKEAKSEIQGRMGAMQVSTKALLSGSTLDITRTMSTPMGDRTSTEKWTLGSDGTLTIESSRPTRGGGTDSVTRVFNKGK